jgi:glyoxylase-like metal-dependent hydrolase (beta-lactamase superfamily II)
MKVCDGIYAYIWKGVFENNCNMFYFSEPLNMLFDPGLVRHMDLRFDAMKKDGINPDDIKFVVNTHSHPDHFEGSYIFADKGIPVGMHQEDLDFITDFGPSFAQMLGMKMPPVKISDILAEGKWKVGDIELEIYHTPGHSPGSISVYWPEKKALVCGDLIFEASVGRVDFPGGDGRILKKSIERMAELDIEIVLPGHMNFIQGRDKVLRNFEMIRSYFSFI